MIPLSSTADSTIDILLATYNGAQYLEEQLASIEAQTHENWRLIARDDGSADQTPEILATFQARHGERVTILHDGDGNVGLVPNFSRLMEASTAPYTAFCDQDDVWLSEKLSLCLDKMRDLEAAHGTEKPLLVFTDLTVMNKHLKVIHSSFWRYQNLKPQRCNELNRLLLQNVVTGCTVLANRPLVRKAMPVPQGAIVHDWWIALVAAAFGKAAFVPKPTVLYRQHANNLIGAKAIKLSRVPRQAFLFLKNFKKNKKRILAPFVQANKFMQAYSLDLSEEQLEKINIFYSIPRRKLFIRFSQSLSYEFMPTTITRVVIFLILSKGEI